MKVILISGKAQHGKDTTAQFLKDALEARGKRVLITHYGDLLKYICRTFFGWDGQKDEAGRSLLQRVGTDVIRAQAPDYWVDFIGGFLFLFPDEWDYVLIPDCRFPNEIDYLRHTFDFDTTHLRVVRPDFDNGLTEEQKAHPSETALDDVTPDYVFYNEGSLEDLRQTTKSFVNNLVAFARYLSERCLGTTGKQGAPGVCHRCRERFGLMRIAEDSWRCAFCGWEG